MINKFNIRVYGIWLKKHKILLSHENIDGFQMVKFPGGGLEFGEGIKDGLRREFREELRIDIHILRHIHTTDSFIRSAFKTNEQVIAVHYLVDSLNEIENYEVVQPTGVGKENSHRFKWHDITPQLEHKLTFEMDREAFRKLNR